MRDGRGPHGWRDADDAGLVGDERTEQRQGVEPSSVHHASAFRDVVKAIASKAGWRNVVLVIDNIDRVPPDELRACWSLLTFVRDVASELERERVGEPGGPEERGPAPLVVVVPYDRERVAMALREGSGVDSSALPTKGDDDASGWIERMFPVRMRIPQRATLLERETLASLLRRALPLGEVDRSDVVGVWTEAQGNRASAEAVARATVTPRDLRVFVNELVAAFLAAPDGEAYRAANVARHVLWSRRKEYVDELYGEGTKLFRVPAVDAARMWSELRSLYYGIPARKAEEIHGRRRLYDAMNHDATFLETSYRGDAATPRDTLPSAYALHTFVAGRLDGFPQAALGEGERAPLLSFVQDYKDVALEVLGKEAPTGRSLVWLVGCYLAHSRFVRGVRTDERLIAQGKRTARRQAGAGDADVHGPAVHSAWASCDNDVSEEFSVLLRTWMTSGEKGPLAVARTDASGVLAKLSETELRWIIAGTRDVEIQKRTMGLLFGSFLPHGIEPKKFGPTEISLTKLGRIVAEVERRDMPAGKGSLAALIVASPLSDSRCIDVLLGFLAADGENTGAHPNIVKALWERLSAAREDRKRERDHDPMRWVQVVRKLCSDGDDVAWGGVARRIVDETARSGSSAAGPNRAVRNEAGLLLWCLARSPDGVRARVAQSHYQHLGIIECPPQLRSANDLILQTLAWVLDVWVNRELTSATEHRSLSAIRARAKKSEEAITTLLKGVADDSTDGSAGNTRFDRDAFRLAINELADPLVGKVIPDAWRRM